MENRIIQSEVAYKSGMEAAKLNQVLSTNPFLTNPEYGDWLQGQEDQRRPSLFAEWNWGDRPVVPKKMKITLFDHFEIQLFKLFKISTNKNQIKLLSTFYEYFQYRDILKLK